MNRSALTEQRRETVIGLLKSMNIKKCSEGGFDKDDVYDCMQQLCDLYEKSIEELETAYETELGQLKDRYQKYDENNELYVSLIMEAKKSSNEIIAQAKTEVETILAEGKAQVEQQELELNQLRIDMEAEKQTMIVELDAAREAIEAEKAAMKAEAEAEREKAIAAKNKYTQLLNSMDEEFEEIKTNILRTAGKIDSLRSKIPNDDEVEWKMMDELAAVDFPVSEIEIDSIIETPAAYDTIAVEGVAVEEPVVEEIVVEEPVVEEIIIEEPVVEVSPAEEPAEAETEAFTLEDLTSLEGFADIPDAEPVPIEELSFDDIEIELPELEAAVEEAPVEEAAEIEELAEISFEGLEELFKEEK